MRWGKRGARSGGSGSGGGGDPMQMISMILMIVSLVIGMAGQCKDKKEKPKDIYEGQKELPGPSSPPAKKCSDLGGFPCNPVTEDCRGDQLPARDNTLESICYSEKPRPLNEPEGDKIQKPKSCAAQKGFNCGIERYCPNNQWLPATDTQTCCQVGCVTRIQTSATFPHLGETVVERFDGRNYGVWYGEDPQTRAFDANIGFRTIGHPNFAQARSIGKNKYEFGVEGKTYAFDVTKDESGEIGVVVG